MKRIKIWHDQFAECPFEAWDCEPDLMYSGGRGMEKDFSKGNILSDIQNKATFGRIIKHQQAIAEILEIDLQYYKDYDFAPHDKVNDIESEMSQASIEQLAKLCDLFKIPYLLHNSTGYSQGDWAEVLIVLTEEFFTKTGCDRKNSEEILKGTAKLFDQWAWGDTYGFTIEECKEYVKIPRDKFDAGEFEDPETELEWEEIDSCSGFYGDDWMTNGMADYIDKELHEQLKNYNYNDIEYDR